MNPAVTEALAVLQLVRWLSGDDITNDDARDALQLLVDTAGMRLQATPDVDVTRAINTTAAANEACEAISRHLAHGGKLPWPSIRRPHQAWLDATGTAPSALDPATTTEGMWWP